MDGANLTKVTEQLQAVAIGDKARAQMLNVMIQSGKADSSNMLSMHAQELTRLNKVGAFTRSAFESRRSSFEAEVDFNTSPWTARALDEEGHRG